MLRAGPARAIENAFQLVCEATKSSKAAQQRSRPDALCATGQAADAHGAPSRSPAAPTHGEIAAAAKADDAKALWELVLRYGALLTTCKLPSEARRASAVTAWQCCRDLLK